MQSVGFIALAVLVTSAVAGRIWVTWRGRRLRLLGRAGLDALEIVGAGAICFVANLMTGMIVIGAVHALMGRFVSHYILSDVSLLSLSLLQGMVFTSWRRAADQDKVDIPPGAAPSCRSLD